MFATKVGLLLTYVPPAVDPYDSECRLFGVTAILGHESHQIHLGSGTVLITETCNPERVPVYRNRHICRRVVLVQPAQGRDSGRIGSSRPDDPVVNSPDAAFTCPAAALPESILGVRSMSTDAMYVVATTDCTCACNTTGNS